MKDDHYILIYKGDSKCNRAKFTYYPDMQTQIKLDMDYFSDRKIPVKITCRVRNFNELEELLCIISALQCADFIISEIKFAYLFGTRSDRLFTIGDAHYFRDVVAPIINAMPGRKEFLHPHGRSSEYLKRCCGASYNSFSHDEDFGDALNIDNKLLLAGDRSAWNLIDDYFFVTDKNFNDAMYFDKIRRLGGLDIALNSTADNLIQTSELDTILIIDDLCDGGATFRAEADYLRKHYPDKKLHLFVVHGLFSGGIYNITQFFDRVYTTNSYQEFVTQSDKIKVIEVI